MPLRDHNRELPHLHSKGRGGKGSALLVAHETRDEHAEAADGADLTDEHAVRADTAGTDDHETDLERSHSEREEA